MEFAIIVSTVVHVHFKPNATILLFFLNQLSHFDFLLLEKFKCILGVCIIFENSNPLLIYFENSLS